jgi:5-methyltetrahydropteroyltriglutamate--homocysteine methyltransferase
MKRPPYRADHVGSLLRPPELIEARARRACGELSAKALRAVEDEAIRHVVRRQEKVGCAASPTASSGAPISTSTS